MAKKKTKVKKKTSWQKNKPFSITKGRSDTLKFLGIIRSIKDVHAPLGRARLITACITTAVVLGCAVFLIFFGYYRTPDFFLMLTAAIVLAGLIIYEGISRRLWEHHIGRHIQKMMQEQERAIRETARTRGELMALKDGLAETGALSDLEHESSLENRMLQAVIDKLVTLGQTQRQDIVMDDETQPPVVTLPQTSFSTADTPRMSETYEYNYNDTEGAQYSDTVVMELTRYAVENDKIDLFLQPIVNLPQRKPRFYEVYSRVRATEGIHIPATRFMHMAQAEALVPALDNLLLLRCIQLLRDTQAKKKQTVYFCNISSTTLNDTGFMGDLAEFLAQNRKLAPRLVFELAQDDLESIDPKTVPILDGLSQLGCQFSMDRIEKTSFDLDMLQDLHIRYLKINTRTILRDASDRDGIIRMRRLKKVLDQNGIDLIVEKIERERDLRELMDFNIDYGQGFLFARPEVYKPHRKVA